MFGKWHELIGDYAMVHDLNVSLCPFSWKNSATSKDLQKYGKRSQNLVCYVIDAKALATVESDHRYRDRANLNATDY